MNSFNANHKAILDKFMLRLPGVTAAKAFGYPAYKINGKVFAFVENSGIVLKLPENRIRDLSVSSRIMRRFEPVKGMIWEEWLSVQRLNSTDYWLDLGLFEEAACYVLDGEQPNNEYGRKRKVGLLIYN